MVKTLTSRDKNKKEVKNNKNTVKKRKKRKKRGGRVREIQPNTRYINNTTPTHSFRPSRDARAAQ